MIRFVDLKTPEEERKMFAILTYHKKICAQDLGVHSRDVYTPPGCPPPKNSLKHNWEKMS